MKNKILKIKPELHRKVMNLKYGQIQGNQNDVIEFLYNFWLENKDVVERQ